MTTLNQYFDCIICISLLRRQDRRDHAIAEAKKHKFTFEFFDGYDIKDEGGGNYGCNCSHRAVMEIIAWNRWPRVLVLEDDFEFVVPDANAAFSEMISEVPEDWEFLYLGGHFADDPKYRHSKHVIRFNQMLTTSSYAVTWQTARTVAPWIQGGSGIDSLMSGFTEKMRAYILDPRICCQYTSFSDIQCREMENKTCMTDSSHIERMDKR